MIWLLNHFLKSRFSLGPYLLDLTIFFTRFIVFVDVFSHSIFTDKLFTFLTWLLVFHFDDFLSFFNYDRLLRALVHAYILNIELRVTRLLVSIYRLLLCLILVIPSLFLSLMVILLGLLIVLLHLLLGVVLLLANMSIFEVPRSFSHQMGTIDKLVLVVLGRFSSWGILVGLALRVFSISHGFIVLEPA